MTSQDSLVSAGPAGSPGRPFGTTMTAMVTPFGPDGSVDLDKVAELATRLVDAGNDGLVVNGTTGESPTTSDSEKADIVRVTVQTVGARATVVSGIGTNDTAHSIELAGQAERAGAHGGLLVTPYYSRPQQAGLLAHFTAVADATGLPIMLYDIPARAVVPIATDTLKRLAEHPRIVAVKDAKGDLQAGTEVMAATDLAYYCGDDPLILPWMSIGAVGVVSIIAHVVAPHVAAMVDAANSGDLATARRIHLALVPVHRAMARTGGGAGLVFAKAALAQAGFDVGVPRLPQVAVTPEQSELIAADLAELTDLASLTAQPRSPFANNSGMESPS